MPNNERRRQWRKEKKAKLLGISVDEVVDGRGRHHNHCKGSRHYKWAGELLTNDGYRLVRVGLSHPLADPNGYVREHILIAASFYGMDRIKGMAVHHINGDKLDNRIENLQILSLAEHNRIHNVEKVRDAKNGRFVGKHRSGRMLDGREWNELPKPKI